MKIPKIADAINNIDEDLVVAAMEDKKKTKRKGIVKWSIAVAASLLIVAAGFFTAGKLGLFDGFNTKDLPKEVVSEGDKNCTTPPAGSDDNEYVPAHKNPDIPEALKAYTLSYADIPQLAKAPQYTDYDFDGDGRMEKEENDAYVEAQKAWREVYAQQKTIKGYYVNEGRTYVQNFTTKVMKEFLKEKNHENRLCSPINIYIALGMLAEVTDGNSRQQVLDLLGVEKIEDLRILMKGLWNSTYLENNIKSELASSMWLRDDMTYNQETLDILAENYYASSFSGEMGSPEYSEAFRTWLNNGTDGLLEDQIGNMELKKDLIMALATTVCFSAKWLSEFDPNSTTPDVFYSADGEKQCEFMHKRKMESYFWGDKFGAIINGLTGDSGMMFILPDEGVSVYDLLEDEQVQDFITKGYFSGNKKEVIINMSIPKFDVSSDNDLCESLAELGITDVFDQSKADFSPLSDDSEGIYLTGVNHGVRVIADEEGVKAAAYTVEQLMGSGPPKGEEIDFVLDRPFIFIIRLSGIPMFIGIVENP